MWQPVIDALPSGDPSRVACEAVRTIADQPQVAAAALVRANPPLWEVVATSPEGAAPPLELAAESLDQDRPVDRGPWSAAPLPGGSEVLLLSPPVDPGDLASLAGMLASWLQVARTQRRLSSEAERLRTLLKLVNEWRQTNDLKTLLDQMAAAACELLDADRASIFLWDRPNHALVGRPAIGIEGGELRIADNAGVVGAVLASGEPMRASPQRDDKAIDRTTDKLTGYQTRSLLAVPLVTPAGDKLGVFELINKRFAAEFSLEDQRGLMDLAEYASVALAATQEFQWLLEQHDLVVEQQAAGARLIGDCPAIVKLRSTISRVAETDLAVLVLGENGTGKEVVAQSIHYNSSRRRAPFVAVNCAAIAETLLESELFGHEKGAFTDAREARAGKFELADGGTLLLDEIGDMSLGGQAKLLRVLEEKRVVRVGGSTEIATDVRVLAATNQDLAALVRQKRFREDLYFRLTVVTLELPPLRQRGEDILTLAEHFLTQFCRAAGRSKPKWTAESKKRLLAHRWNGNVRELRNLTERLAYLTTGDKIDPADLTFIAPPGAATGAQGSELLDLGLPLTEATDEFQRRYITANIQSARGNISEAAKRLGVFRTNLYRKMTGLGMSSDEDEEGS